MPHDAPADDPARELVGRIHEIGIKTFLLTDCMINAEGKDISSYARGGFPELEEYLMQHYDI